MVLAIFLHEFIPDVPVEEHSHNIKHVGAIDAGRNDLNEKYIYLQLETLGNEKVNGFGTGIDVLQDYRRTKPAGQ